MSDMKIWMHETDPHYPAGFYPEDCYPPEPDGSRNKKIPKDAVEITRKEWEERMTRVYLSPPPPPDPDAGPEVMDVLKEILARLDKLEKGG